MIRNLFSTRRKRAQAAAAIAAAFVLGWLLWMLFVPIRISQSNQTATINIGQSLSSVAEEFKEQGFIRSSTLFVVYVSLRGWSHKLEAGVYTLPSSISLYHIAGLVVSGKGAMNDQEVFIPEGANIWEIDGRLADAGLVERGQFAKTYYLKEGMLFPDTYRFKKGSTMAQIETIMENNFTAKTGALLAGVSDTALTHLITKASIIEKEAASESDMRLVSGVISNRLAIGMPLAIDATVAYGACLRKFLANPSKDCLVQDVAVGTEVSIDSTFNSYIRSGLPPRPISNPGLNAIQAALHPTGDYLYYLSPRGGGALIFAHTAAEHAANRRKYLGL